MNNTAPDSRNRYRLALTTCGMWERLTQGQREALSKLIAAADVWLIVPGQRRPLQRITGYESTVLTRTIAGLAALGLMVKRDARGNHHPATYKLTLPNQ